MALRLAGAFLAAVLRLVALRLAGAFFAALRRFVALRLAGAFFAVDLRFVALRFAGAFFAAVLRLVALRFAGALRFAALRAGAFFAAAFRLAGAFLFFVAFLAGGTVTTFLRELSLGEVRTSGHSGARECSRSPYSSQELTRFLKSDPTVNFTLLEAGIWIGSRVCGFIPVRAARAEGAKVPKPGSVTLSPPATAPWTALMNELSALSASALLSDAELAIASTSSPLFTGTNLHASACVRAMRTYSRDKVKHLRRCAREIHHLQRVLCNDRALLIDAYSATRFLLSTTAGTIVR